jgi:predicted AAA+ superfamily ATPase
MDEHLRTLVWRGITASNPWWETGIVPPERVLSNVRRHAFDLVYQTFKQADRGRGVVLLGPRRVGKTFLLHQVVQQLLLDGVDPRSICLLALDDVALRARDLGELLDLVEGRLPVPNEIRFLLLDEVQHAPQWAGWLKRIADRRDPYRFLATGSSATALAHGGQDAGLGRWREITLFPWSFREHVQLRGLTTESPFADIDLHLRQEHRVRWFLELNTAQAAALDAALVDYLLRGGFPEAARAPDLLEARRRLRQDILDRALGRDIIDTVAADPRALEGMFLRICLQSGGLWNSSEVARDLGISRPSVARYLDILERSFLVFRLPNLASPVKGQPKVYLVAPSLRQALLGMDEKHLEAPEEWGRMAENAMAATLVGTRPSATSIGFWRRGNVECDGVVLDPQSGSELIEVKRSGKKAVAGIVAARDALHVPQSDGWILGRDGPGDSPATGIVRTSLAAWLYQQDAAAGGTVRFNPTGPATTPSP